MPYYEVIETYLLAAILDPRFKLHWSNDAEKESLIDLLKTTVKKMESLQLKVKRTKNRTKSLP